MQPTSLPARPFIFAGPAALSEEKLGKPFVGVASYYDKGYRGRVANGDQYDPAKFTAAHRTLPFGTRLRVTGPDKRSVTVTITDRGPFIKTRVLDLSYAAATKLGMIGHGLIRVSAEVEEPLPAQSKAAAP